MKSILKIFIILIITLSTSACFDNMYNVHINGVAAPNLSDGEPDCTPEELFEIDGGHVYHTEGIMDLAYSKIVGSKSGIYGYTMKLNVFNLLSDEAKDNVNIVHLKKANITVLNHANNLVEQEVITIDSTISPQGAAVIPIRILSNRNKWQNPDALGGIDMTRAFLYQGLYNVDKAANNLEDPNAGLTTPYVKVKVTLEGETLGGVSAVSDTFEFKVNLCINCLICPVNNIHCQDDLSYNPSESMDDITYYCPGSFPNVLCGLAQDTGLMCGSLEGK